MASLVSSETVVVRRAASWRRQPDSGMRAIGRQPRRLRCEGSGVVGPQLHSQTELVLRAQVLWSHAERPSRRCAGRRRADPRALRCGRLEVSGPGAAARQMTLGVSWEPAAASAGTRLPAFGVPRPVTGSQPVPAE